MSFGNSMRMVMLLVVAELVGWDMAGTFANPALAEFFSGTFAGWAGEAAFTGASFAFEIFGDVKNVLFGNHALAGTAATAHDAFAFAVVAVLFAFFFSQAGLAGFVLIALPITKLAVPDGSQGFLETVFQLLCLMVMVSLEPIDF